MVSEDHFDYAGHSYLVMVDRYSRWSTVPETRQFMDLSAVRQRISSANNPHSNLWAESAVQTVKRLVRENTGSKGSLDTDKMAMALVANRNTPDRDTGLSPAQVLFSQKLRDAIPCDPEGLRLRPEWVFFSIFIWAVAHNTTTRAKP